MPQVAYIVKLDQPNGVDKLVTADEIREELESAGFSVIAVNPWSSPEETTLLAQPFLGESLLSPNQSPQQL